MTVETLSMNVVYRGWAKYSRARFRLPDGETVDREIEDHGSAIAVLPYDDGRRVAMLVRQFRAPVYVTSGETELLEAIAGLIEEPDSADTARREAREETGLHLGAVEFVAKVWTMPGLSTESMALYLARYDSRDRLSDGGGQAHEQEHILPVEMSLSELADRADSGRVTDMKLFALVQTLRLRRPELFRP